MSDTTNSLATGLAGNSQSENVTTNTFATGLLGNWSSPYVATNPSATGLPGDGQPPPPPGPAPATLTTVPNGFRKGTNFSDPEIVSGTDIYDEIVAIGQDPGYTPPAGRWSLVTDDPKYSRVARLAMNVGVTDFWMYLAGQRGQGEPGDTLPSFRFRAVMKFHGLSDVTELQDVRFIAAHSELSNPHQQTWTSFNSTGYPYIMSTNVSAPTDTADSLALSELIVSGDWVECIYEMYNSGTESGFRIYGQAPGAARPVLLHSQVSPYIDEDDPAFDQVFLFYSSFTAATFVDFAALEFCNVYDGSGNEIPIENMGKDSTPPDPPEHDWNPVTGQYVLDTDGTIPQWFDYADRWNSDAAWKAVMQQDYFGTEEPNGPFLPATGANNDPDNVIQGSSGSKLIGLKDNPSSGWGAQFSGKVFENVRLAKNEAASTRHAELIATFSGSAAIRRFILSRRVAYCAEPPFTAVGDATSPGGIDFNDGQDSGYKNGMYFIRSAGGRMGIESGNWDEDSGFYQHFVYEDDGTLLTTIVMVRIDESEWMQTGELFDEELRSEWWVGGDGRTYYSMQWLRKMVGSTTWYPVVPRLVYDYAPGTELLPAQLFSPTGLNYNQSRATDLLEWTKGWAIFDMEDGEDPFRSQAWLAAQQPTAPTDLSVVSATSSAVTYECQARWFTGALRARIDDEWVSGQDRVMTREEGAKMVTTPSWGTIEWPTLEGNITISPTLSPGQHTLEVFAVSEDGQTLSATGPSVPFMVS